MFSTFIEKSINPVSALNAVIAPNTRESPTMDGVAAVTFDVVVATLNSPDAGVPVTALS